ncbi:MAG: hypothetical protein ACP5HJ_01510 [Candidatus Micrarchaeia archaeon]
MEESEKGRKPVVYSFSIPAQIISSLNDIALKLKTLNFLSVTQKENTLIVYNVETRDIKKEPYLFYILEFKKEGIEVSYSVIPDISPKQRKVVVLKALLDILVLLKEDLKVDTSLFFSILSSSIQEFLASIPQNYETLFGKYDSLLESYKELQRNFVSLQNSNKMLSLKVTELIEKNAELEARIRKLETLSDEVLMLKVQDWLLTHNGTINIGEFSALYKVPEARVEEILNKMISLGYIQPG